MSDPFGERPFPRGVLIAVAILLGSIILAIAIARIMGVDPEQIPLSEAVEVRELRFVEREDGTLAVHDVASGQVVRVLEVTEGGFVRGVLRTMARERMLHRADPDGPFSVARRADGYITLEDPGTGILLRLRAFGPSNEGAFAELLAAARQLN